MRQYACAPQFWQSASASGGGNANRPLTWDEWVAFKAAQEEKTAGAGFAVSEAFDVPSQVAKVARGLTQAVSRAASTSEGGGGAGLLGFVESAAGTLLGGGDGNSDGDDTGSNDGGTFDDDLISADAGASSTSLGDAQPFEYQRDYLSDDVAQVAARGVSEAVEADCFGKFEFDLEQCDFVRAMTQDPRAYAVCKETAFQNYQRCRGF